MLFKESCSLEGLAAHTAIEWPFFAVHYFMLSTITFVDKFLWAIVTREWSDCCVKSSNVCCKTFKGCEWFWALNTLKIFGFFTEYFHMFQQIPSFCKWFRTLVTPKIFVSFINYLDVSYKVPFPPNNFEQLSHGKSLATLWNIFIYVFKCARL